MNTTKRNVVVSAVMAIVVCISLIAGATFALFTSESTVNIAVTSGKVSVVASMAVTDVYSPTAIDMSGAVTDPTNAADVATATFANGGTAIVTGGGNSLTLANMTPGDKASYTISIQNNGNVETLYRYGYSVVASGEGHTTEEAYKLYQGLIFQFGSVTTANVAMYRSAWATLSSSATISGSIQMPTTAGNQLSALSATIVFTVEAVQGNADVTGSPEQSFPIVTASQAESMLENATENSTITVATTETVQLPTLGTGKNGLTLTGADRETTKLETNATQISANDVTISNATIQGQGAAGNTGALNINGNNTTIDSVDFVGQGTGGDIGIAVSTGASNTGTVIKNSTITNAFRGIQFWKLSGDSVIEDCKIEINGYTFNVDSVESGATLTVKNTILNGWTSYTDGVELVKFENCKFGKCNFAYLRPYSNTELINCEFTDAGFKLNADGSAAFTITLNNCTKNGVAITADNVLSLLVDTDGWNHNATLIVNGTTVIVP